MTSLEGHSEPSWFKDIKFDDSDTEQLADENDLITTSKTYLDLTGSIFDHISSVLVYSAVFAIQAQPAPAKEHQSAVSIQQWTAIPPPLLT